MSIATADAARDPRRPFPERRNEPAVAPCGPVRPGGAVGIVDLAEARRRRDLAAAGADAGRGLLAERPQAGQPLVMEEAVARIYQPAPAVTQAGRARAGQWLLELLPRRHPVREPLMGWTGGEDPFGHVRLRFPDRESAIAFARRQGWRYELVEPRPRKPQRRSYGDNFRWPQR